MANGDNPLPQMQLDPNAFPTSAPAPQPQPAPAPTTPAPSTPSTATPPAPASDTASSIAPTPISVAQNAGAQGLPAPYQSSPAVRGGPVKNILTRMFYGMGQAAMAHVGLPTDYDIQKTTYQQALQANEQQLKQAQFAWQQSQVPVMTPYGLMNFPLLVAQKMGPAFAQEMGRLGAAGIQTRYQKTPLGIIDTWNPTLDQNGNVQPMPGTSGGTMKVTQDHVDRFGFDPQLLGQTLPINRWTEIANTNARWAPQQRTGVSYQTDQYGNITPMPTWGTTQRIAPGAPTSVAPPAAGPPTVGAPAPPPGAALPPAVTNRVPPTSPAGQAFAGGGAQAGAPGATPTAPPGGLVGKSAFDSVVGIDANGNQVLTSRTAAQNMGLSQVQKADANTVTSALKARRWMTDLASIPGSDPQTNPMGSGITQLINDLDRRGMLGPLAGRFNEFMAGTWGQGDPEYQALRTKLDLSNTLLASVHTGSRGGWNLIDNFKNLADQGKLSGAALKAAYGSEMDYVRRTQMLPAAQGGGAGMPATPNVGDIVNGYKYNGGPPGNPNSWVKQ